MAYLSVRDGRIKTQGTKGQKLTPKMVSFIDAYFGEANFNAKRAIELSAYKSFNPSIQAAELLNHPLVQAEIKRRQDVRSDKAEVKAEMLIVKLMNIIDDPDTKTSDILRAIELAGRSIALWKDRQEISGPDGAAIRHEQHVKESVADFTSRISRLAERNGTDGANVVPIRRGTGGTPVAVEVLGPPESTSS